MTADLLTGLQVTGILLSLDARHTTRKTLRLITGSSDENPGQEAAAENAMAPQQGGRVEDWQPSLRPALSEL